MYECYDLVSDFCMNVMLQGEWCDFVKAIGFTIFETQ